MDAMFAMRALGSLLIVLGLMAGCAVLLRRYGHKVTGMSFSPANKAKARLEVVETKLIDARSKLLLIRRDTVEHLLIVSATGAVVIESSITPDKIV
jgi:flagellar protein FliO/FliZ